MNENLLDKDVPGLVKWLEANMAATPGGSIISGAAILNYKAAELNIQSVEKASKLTNEATIKSAEINAKSTNKLTFATYGLVFVTIINVIACTLNE